MTLQDLLKHFLTAKQRWLEAGELKPKSSADYHNSNSTERQLVKAFGTSRLVSHLTVTHVGLLRTTLAKAHGPFALGNEIQRVRCAFKHGYEAGLFGKPMRMDTELVKPSAKAMRETRQANRNRMLEPSQIR